MGYLLLFNELNELHWRSSGGWCADSSGLVANELTECKGVGTLPTDTWQYFL